MVVDAVVHIQAKKKEKGHDYLVPLFFFDIAHLQVYNLARGITSRMAWMVFSRSSSVWTAEG